MSKPIGFAAMSSEERKRMASLGGKAVSKNRLHMAEIGRKGGERSGVKRAKTQTENDTNQEGLHQE